MVRCQTPDTKLDAVMRDREGTVSTAVRLAPLLRVWGSAGVTELRIQIGAAFWDTHDLYAWDDRITIGTYA